MELAVSTLPSPPPSFCSLAVNGKVNVEVKQAFNTEADNSGGSLSQPPQDLERKQVTSES
ncbi:hypothetical protein BGZ52_009701, partial [Haplosporangium bisporale]